MEFIKQGTELIAQKPWPAARTDDERWMLRALELACLGRRTASPNPSVGAVVVSNGVVVGEGYHEKAGGPHAEVNAMRAAAGLAEGATIYLTLEPCSHQGRTPPCAGMLARAGIARAVVAMQDPNPLVAGKGSGILRDAGVEVVAGPYGDLAARLNEAYVKWITTGAPFLTLKMAMSLDGKAATRVRDSKWITSEASRLDVHRLRAESDAVMVGIGTVLEDDPFLTAREVDAVRQPLRVIVDSMARTPVTSNVVKGREAPTLIAVTPAAPREKRLALEEAGAEVVEVGEAGRVDLAGLMRMLGAREITSVLSEGGPTLAAALWELGLADKLVFFVAPKIVGGDGAPGPIGGWGVESMSEARGVVLDAVAEMGSDLKLVAYPAGG